MLYFKKYFLTIFLFLFSFVKNINGLEYFEIPEYSKNNKHIRILTIDGGGIRGIIPAVILDRIESELHKKLDCPVSIAECFDIISGTSTGGIISLGLNVPVQEEEGYRPRYSAKDLVGFYQEKSSIIFPPDKREESYILNSGLFYHLMPLLGRAAGAALGGALGGAAVPFLGRIVGGSGEVPVEPLNGILNNIIPLEPLNSTVSLIIEHFGSGVAGAVGATVIGGVGGAVGAPAGDMAVRFFVNGADAASRVSGGTIGEAFGGALVGGIGATGSAVAGAVGAAVGASVAGGAVSFGLSLQEFINRNFREPIFEQEPLKKLFQEYFEDWKLTDSISATIITGYSVTESSIQYFSNIDYFSNNQENYHMRDVALATSAAPLYLPDAKIKAISKASTEKFIDGGMFANNPALSTLVRSMLFSRKRNLNFFIVSLGTGKRPKTLSSSGSGGGVIPWATQAIDVLMDGTSEHNHELVGRISQLSEGDNKYYRIQTILESNILDMSDVKNIEELRGSARHRSGLTNEDIKEIIEESLVFCENGSLVLRRFYYNKIRQKGKPCIDRIDLDGIPLNTENNIDIFEKVLTDDQWSKTREINISRTGIVKLPNILRKNLEIISINLKELEHIKLRNNRINKHDDIDSIISFIKESEKITKVDLSNNEITKDGFLYFLKKFNTNITKPIKFIFDGNPFVKEKKYYPDYKSYIQAIQKDRIYLSPENLEDLKHNWLQRMAKL